jgi:Domain of unknown function (DUF4293)
MLQRKQSLWLLFAALLNAGVLYFDLYKYHIIENGADAVKQLRVSDHYPSLLIALVMIILPLVTIFMFKTRKRQIGLSAVSIVAVGSFITMALGRVNGLSKLTPPATNGSYWIGSVLPVVALVFLFLAIMGIRSDEKLVKSVDRLR